MIPADTIEEKTTQVQDDEGKFRLIRIPQDPRKPIEEITLDPQTDDLRRLLQLSELVGGYIEVVRTTSLLNIGQGLHIPTSMMLCAGVDEDGYRNGRKPNSRASGTFYPGDLVGDVLIMCSGPDGEGGYDLVGLPDQVTVETLSSWVLSHPQLG